MDTARGQDVWVSNREELAQRFRAMAEGSYRDVPLYRRLALGMADRDRLLDLALALPTQALSGGLLFAVVHREVLEDAGHPFAQLWDQEVRHPRSVGAFEEEFESFIFERTE